jgi:hypothetical protein
MSIVSKKINKFEAQSTLFNVPPDKFSSVISWRAVACEALIFDEFKFDPP